MWRVSSETVTTSVRPCAALLQNSCFSRKSGPLIIKKACSYVNKALCMMLIFVYCTMYNYYWITAEKSAMSNRIYNKACPDLESESHGQSRIKNWSPTFKMGGKKRLTIAVGVHFLYFSIKVKRSTRRSDPK